MGSRRLPGLRDQHINQRIKRKPLPVPIVRPGSLQDRAQIRPGGGPGQGLDQVLVRWVRNIIVEHLGYTGGHTCGGGHGSKLTQPTHDRTPRTP
jgi:hypothetical protein